MRVVVRCRSLFWLSPRPSLAAAGGENWPQWRGPGGQGISTERTCRPSGRRQEHRVEDASCRQWHSSPIVWGDRIFLTAAIEGDVVPGAKAVEHIGRRARTGSTPTASRPTRSTR